MSTCIRPMTCFTKRLRSICTCSISKPVSWIGTPSKLARLRAHDRAPPAQEGREETSPLKLCRIHHDQVPTRRAGLISLHKLASNAHAVVDLSNQALTASGWQHRQDLTQRHLAHLQLSASLQFSHQITALQNLGILGQWLCEQIDSDSKSHGIQMQLSFLWLVLQHPFTHVP